MARASDILTVLAKEIELDGLFSIVESEAGLFSPPRDPKIALRPKKASYADMRGFMVEAYSRMALFLHNNGECFSPDLFFGPGREHKIRLGFGWQSLRIDEFEFQKEELWTEFKDIYYDWSAQERYLLISGEYP